MALLSLAVLAASAGLAAQPSASDPVAAPPVAQAEVAPAPPPTAPSEDSKPVLLGTLTREEIESAAPDWVEAEIEARPDDGAIVRLGSVAPGATVTIYLGTWCGDSRRELARLWKALDQAGLSISPFGLTLVGVDRTKTEPADRLAGVGLSRVPTIVVERDGREVGRIIEESPHGIEVDLLSLLDGTARGALSAKPEYRGGASE